MVKEKPDRPVLWLIKRGNGLVAGSQFDMDYLDRYRDHARVTCTIEQPGQDSTLRRIYGLIGLIAKGTGEDPKSLKVRMMLRCGSIQSVDHIQGLGTTIAPERLRDMEEPERLELWERLVELVLLEYLPFLQRPDLVAEVQKYVGVDHEAKTLPALPDLRGD